MKKNKWWISLIILQVLVLFGIAGSYYGVDYFGKEIQLKTKPVDPTDVFSGDYVSLNYEISDAPDSLWKGEPIKEPTPVYVVLAPENGKYHIEKLTNRSPDVSGSQVYLKAKATPSMVGMLHLEYGLERFYVEENTGKKFEEPGQEYSVAVKVAPWGKGVIQKIQPEK
ncbi:Uncharacterized membrane-anchored protein [Fictibacillus solisalsi]|uniref:Uncharacterized membrane-anchored protein n=1 Tax=Fictibacillus solisalsi TaxID=459525 RepID=A0A1H0ATV4_9BACL|nr:GDYXXLXY domain-containing protein [Fictibacillus solisalsi]SDN36902.1 Uncharacterized membrane-anchored protein [Fictibacillus solisalsi]